MAAAPPPPSPDFLARFATWLGRRVNDVIRTLLDPDATSEAFAELAFAGTAPQLSADLLARLDREAQAGSDPEVQDAETFFEVVAAFAAVTDAMIAANGDEEAALPELMADFLDLVIAADLKRSAPAAWAILRMLGVVIDDVAQLGRLSQLIHHPGAYLQEQLAAPATGAVGPDYRRDYAAYSLVLAAIGATLAVLVKPIPNLGPKDWLDPHGQDTNAFGIDVLYGWTPPDPAQLDPTDPHNPYPHLMELLPRMLTLRLDAQTAATGALPGAHDKLDITAALVPAQHIPAPDGWGLYLRFTGLVELELPLGAKWQLSVKPSDAPAFEVLLAGGGKSFARAAASAGIGATLALERPADASGSWVLGPAQGSHLEVQHARVALTVEDDDKRGLLFDLGLHSDHVIVDVELGSDSFLRSVLPPSIRIDTKLGLGVELGEHGRGFYFDGGVALVMDLPVTLPPVTVTAGTTPLLSVVVQGLHLRIDLGDGSGGALSAAFTVDLAVRIGDAHAITGTVAGVGVRFALRQAPAGPPAADGTPAAGHWQPSFSGVPPNGVGLVVALGRVTGGGFIGYDAQAREYTGALQLKAQLLGHSFDVTGLGTLDTQIPGSHDDAWALLVILTATLGGGYQVGGGFELTGLGGVVGHNHALDADAIAAGLRTKALDSILFPPDPVVQAPHIFATWRQTLPVAEGHTVLGLMAQFSWGSKDLSECELALLLDTGTPVQTVLLISVRLHAPSVAAPVFHARIDGIARLPDFLLEAELIDSKFGTFPVTGGLVAVARGSDHAYLISCGGFNPGFTPPADLPAVDRLRLDISSGSNPRVRLELYAAITSNSLQAGARLQLHAAAGPLAVDGWLAFDGLLESGWQFSVEIGAGLSLSFDGSPLMEVSLDILFEGTRPWHVKGHASLSLLFYTLSLPIDYSTGDTSTITQAVVDPLALVRDALSDPQAWSAPPPAASAIVALRAPAGPALAAHPLGVVSCRQQVVPLELQVTHVGGQALAAPATVDVTGLSLAGAPATDVAPVVEDFAPGQFLDLTDDEKLSRPSFEPMRAGLAAGGASVDAGNATWVATAYKTVAVDGATRTTRPPWPLDPGHATAVLRPPAPPVARPLPVVLAVASDALRTVAGDPGGPQPASLVAQRAGGRTILDLAGVAGGPA